MSARQDRPCSLINTLTFTVGYLVTGPRPCRFLQVRLSRQQKRVLRHVQNIVFIRIYPGVAGRDLVISPSVPEQHSIAALRCIFCLLGSQRERPLGVSFLQVRQSPVRIDTGKPFSRIGAHELPVLIGEDIVLCIQLLRYLIQLAVISGQINRDATRPFNVGDSADHHPVYCRLKLTALLRIHLSGLDSQVPQVDQIICFCFGIRCAQSKSLCLAPGLIEQRVFSFSDIRSHGGKESVSRADHLVRLREVQCRQSHVGVKELRPVLLIVTAVGIHDPAHYFLRITGLIENTQKCIVPASAGLKLLRPHQVIGVVLPQPCALQASHKAGVKSHPVEPEALLSVLLLSEHGRIHGAAQFFQEKAVIFKQLIAPVSPQRSAPVVPQDQSVVLRRIILRAVIHKLRQRLRDSHVRALIRMGDDPLLAVFLLRVL